MKNLLMSIVLMASLLTGCKNPVETAEPVNEVSENVTVTVKYCPKSTHADLTYNYYSTMASVVWNDGDAVVLPNDSTIISVPKMTSLKATYVQYSYNDGNGKTTSAIIHKTLLVTNNSTWILQ